MRLLCITEMNTLGTISVLGQSHVPEGKTCTVPVSQGDRETLGGA